MMFLTAPNGFFDLVVESHFFEGWDLHPHDIWNLQDADHIDM
jgi:hypothetical protein